MYKYEEFLRDNIGKTFGKLTVTRYIGIKRVKNVKQYIIEVVCECGTRKETPISKFEVRIQRNQGSSSVLSCNKCYHESSYFREIKNPKPNLLYEQPLKMHKPEEEKIIDTYNKFNILYNRD